MDLDHCREAVRPQCPDAQEGGGANPPGGGPPPQRFSLVPPRLIEGKEAPGPVAPVCHLADYVNSTTPLTPLNRTHENSPSSTTHPLHSRRAGNEETDRRSGARLPARDRDLLGCLWAHRADLPAECRSSAFWKTAAESLVRPLPARSRGPSDAGAGQAAQQLSFRKVDGFGTCKLQSSPNRPEKNCFSTIPFQRRPTLGSGGTPLCPVGPDLHSAVRDRALRQMLCGPVP